MSEDTAGSDRERVSFEEGDPPEKLQPFAPGRILVPADDGRPMVVLCRSQTDSTLLHTTLDEFLQVMRSRSARSHKVEPHTRSGELTSQSGIITGRLADWADALETTTSELLSAIDRAGVDPLVDTGKRKEGEDHNRPTQPELRCIALTESDVGRISAELLEIAPYQHS